MNEAPFATAFGAADLPALLAVQILKADEARDPRVQLNTLSHLFENLLRLMTAIGVGELRHSHDVAPERIAQTLLLGMTNPTLDTWR